MGRRHEDSPILLGNIDAYDASVVTRLHLGRCMALSLPPAVEAIGSRWATVFKGVPISLEPLESEIPHFTRRWTNTVGGAFFRVHNGINPVWKKWPGDRLCRVIVRLLFFFPPQFADIDQRPNPMLVPEQGFRFAAIQAPIRTEVLAAIR